MSVLRLSASASARSSAISITSTGAWSGWSRNTDSFQSDPRNIAAAESYLRRALEALLDLGRHLLAEGFGQVVIEYKEVTSALGQRGVLDRQQEGLLRTLAGYRNRLVHFYEEVSPRKLYEISTGQLGDIERVLVGILDWINAHPEKLDRVL